MTWGTPCPCHFPEMSAPRAQPGVTLPCLCPSATGNLTSQDSTMDWGISIAIVRSLLQQGISTASGRS
eukprot:CAMPEP_0119108194 /NCGR_PEP_ID=MMETSP1180-20130426/13519_1 /TAXON_ID=3052 ORGANISM="Chlamydomonas cf sp, Strain CCMP681" /NCGR_SAMPLE_ID=MMETSP1180 /ASSEMBLY_ACC=CAM_ASM_000741 /LENGTH=67 /DNA_ID=CAMNT_0007093785 /DNA_START=696 /DNA_END=899 /DNA_ORIENTATION=-